MAASEVQPSPVEEAHRAALHVRFVQSEPRWQVTSQAHDRPQLTSRHEPLPAQSTLHGPAPQEIFLQLWAPLQVIVHDLLARQLIPLRHELPVEHAMLQLQPAGHVSG